jgi:hypothetical protein
LAQELKTVLERIMGIARIMENYQRKLLVLACTKASQITTIMKQASVTNNLDEKRRLYNMHLDNLTALTEQRMQVLDNLRYRRSHSSRPRSRMGGLGRFRWRSGCSEGPAFKQRMWVAIEGALGSAAKRCRHQSLFGWQSKTRWPWRACRDQEGARTAGEQCGRGVHATGHFRCDPPAARARFFCRSNWRTQLSISVR